MQDTVPQTGRGPARDIRTVHASLHAPLPGFPEQFEVTRYLDGSDPTVRGDAMYSAALRGAGEVWDLYVEDSRQAPPSHVLWGADLETACRQLKSLGLARKAARFLDLLLTPVRGMVSFPSPCQRRLLKSGLELSFRDSTMFALMRDMGLAYNSGAIEALAPIIRALPAVLAEAQFGRTPVTAEDHRRVFCSKEEFRAYVSRWIPPEASRITNALTRPATLNWLYDHVVEAIRVVPEKLLASGVFGKICRSLFGVIAFKITHLPKDIAQARVDEEIFESVQAGFHFGRTYLFDEIMDLEDFPREEKKRFFKAVVDLLSGVPVEDSPSDPSARLVLESLRTFKTLFGEPYVRSIYNAYLALALSQIQDGKKSFDGVYPEKDLYAPLMVKSAYTRVLPALLGRLPITSDFLGHAYLTSLPNQLIDDFRDLSDDLASHTFTPYTYYVRGRGTNPDFRHPLAVYLRAISMVARKLGGDPEVRRLWISRFLAGLRVFESKGGKGALRKFLSEHPLGEREFEELLLDVTAATNVVLDPESILASLSSTCSMHVRGMTATPLITH